jgi:hypothetical protein
VIEAPVEVQRKRGKVTLIVILASILALVLLCVFLRVSGLGLRLIANIGPPIDGQTAFIRTPSGGPALFAVDQAALDEAVKGGDTEGMLKAGRIFLVPNGTRVKVIDADARGYTVELLDGTGRRGETAATFVQH